MAGIPEEASPEAPLPFPWTAVVRARRFVACSAPALVHAEQFVHQDEEASQCRADRGFASAG